MAFELTIPVAAKGGGNWHPNNDGNFTKIRNEVNSINSRLDEKMRGDWRYYSGITGLGLAATATLDEIISAMPDKSKLYLNCDSSTSSTVTPYPDYEVSDNQEQYGLLEITRHDKNRICMNFAAHSDSNKRFTAIYNINSTPKFGGWVAFAIAKQPDWYSLPLSAGMSVHNKAYYYKNQFGEVHVSGAIKASETFAAFTIIATLPVGFRPQSHIELPAIYNAPFTAGTIYVHTNGEIGVSLAASTQNYVYFDFSFLSSE